MTEVLIESDRVPQVLVRYAVIPQGSYSNVSATFSIPQDVNFLGQRLELVPQVRSVPLDGSAPAKTWARASWTCEQATFLSGGYVAALDVLWRITSTVGGVSKEYQNAPCSIPMLFCTSAQEWYGAAFPSALEFDQEWYLPGGSTLTVTLTPTYMDMATAPDAYEYRVLCALSGTKEVF